MKRDDGTVWYVSDGGDGKSTILPESEFKGRIYITDVCSNDGSATTDKGMTEAEMKTMADAS